MTRRMPRSASNLIVRGVTPSPWLKPDRKSPRKMSGLNCSSCFQTARSDVTRLRRSPTWSLIPYRPSSRDSNIHALRRRTPRPSRVMGSPLRCVAVGVHSSIPEITSGSNSSPNNRSVAVVRPMLPPTDTYIPSGLSPSAGSHSARFASSGGSHDGSGCGSLGFIRRSYRRLAECWESN